MLGVVEFGFYRALSTIRKEYNTAVEVDAQELVQLVPYWLRHLHLYLQVLQEYSLSESLP